MKSCRAALSKNEEVPVADMMDVLLIIPELTFATDTQNWKKLEELRSFEKKLGVFTKNKEAD